jgi:hypothetical protein
LQTVLALRTRTVGGTHLCVREKQARALVGAGRAKPSTNVRGTAIHYNPQDAAPGSSPGGARDIEGARDSLAMMRLSLDQKYRIREKNTARVYRKARLGVEIQK